MTITFFTPSDLRYFVSSGKSNAPSGSCAPVIATARLYKILNVRWEFEATACLSANDPEWKKVPSPTFWNICSFSIKGSIPTHCAPSPPICVVPNALPSSTNIAIKWHPIPPNAESPSGIFIVEVL